MKTLVLGIGNPLRRDDGFGIAVAERLRALGVDDVEVRPHGGDPAELLDDWRHRSCVVVVDTICSGAAPGTVHRLDLPGDEPPPRWRLDHASSHGAGLADAIELGRVLGALPDRLVIIGVEPGDVAKGAGLTPVVRAAVDRVARMVVAEALAHTHRVERAEPCA